MPKFFYKNLILEIPAGVYEPREDSLMAAEFLEKENLAGKKVLDMGCGSGLLAIISAKKGAEVFATDIDEKSLICARQNARENNAEVNFILSDLFLNLGKEKSDLIIFNAPYLPEKISPFSREWAAGEKLEIIFRFIERAKKFLKLEGKIFLVASSLSGEKKILEKFSEKGFSAHVAGRKKVQFEEILLIKALVRENL